MAAGVFFRRKRRIAAAAQAKFGGQQVAQDRGFPEFGIALEILLDACGLAGLEAALQVDVHQLDQCWDRIRAGGKMGVDVGPIAALPGVFEAVRQLFERDSEHVGAREP
jgi:hypothetical protein